MSHSLLMGIEDEGEGEDAATNASDTGPLSFTSHCSGYGDLSHLSGGKQAARMGPLYRSCICFPEHSSDEQGARNMIESDLLEDPKGGPISITAAPSPDSGNLGVDLLSRASRNLHLGLQISFHFNASLYADSA